ncbi:uncharacterized protein LOC113360724 [Papaver somniferum]|uniref:uncharacterized protein LOC113360724 n=1 Tax=Papaver somniferum TaxID=3469 RepID=UPI000E700A06|nr:uncharacterized protein LOC113360724 [Papaver somniferum]
MDDLPLEIATEIFSGVPAETVLECKRVCKTWQILLSLNKNFADMHLQRQQLPELDHDHNNYNNGAAGSKVNLGFMLILLGEVDKNNSVQQLYYGEYNEGTDSTYHDQKCIPTFPRKINLINHPPIEPPKCRTGSLAGSCHGLICLDKPRKSAFPDSIHICNPITRECSHLQGFNEYLDADRRYRLHIRFGYSPQTNEYKVVRITYIGLLSSIGDIHVYTLGGGSGWRNKGATTSALCGRSGVFANGSGWRNKGASSRTASN